VKKLTVIIPFSNEGAYLKKTLDSIRLTAEEEVDIVIVDDASDDGINYEDIAEVYGCKYIKNEERIGPTASRGKGVELAETAYVLLIDAHMSFYFNDWHNEFVEALEQSSTAVYCANVVPLNRYARRDKKVLKGLLGDSNVIGVTADESKTSFIHNSHGETNLIPVLFGGSYAMSKEYFEALDVSGSLKGVGCFNLLLSLKVFLDGGEVVFLEDTKIGHIYTDLLSYEVDTASCRDDVTLLTGLLLDLSGQDSIENIAEFSQEDSVEDSKEGIEEREKNMNFLKELICDKLNKRTVESFMEFRDSFESGR